MSRIGKKTLLVPAGVTVELQDRAVKVSGPKGELFVVVPENIQVTMEENVLSVKRTSEIKQTKSHHGSVTRLIENALHGVSEGWSKTLELVGTGYRGRLEGPTLILAIGYSHPVKVDPPAGITLSIEENRVTVTGPDRHMVGQVAANIRAIREPDSYKGKGVKYQGEKLRLKPGKAAKTGA